MEKELVVKVKILHSKHELLPEGGIVSEQVKAVDYDGVIQAVEETLAEKYGVSMYFDEDFTIENETELCEELS